MLSSASPSSITPLHSTFLSSEHQKLPPPPPPPPASFRSTHGRNRVSSTKPKSYPCIKAVELDQNTIVAISVGVASVAVGIGIPVFYESQINNSSKRDNTQPCFPCSGSGAQQCRFCFGKGKVEVALGGGVDEVSRCINCDGAGSLTCTTCQGSGIQPRYLDRREFKDDDE